MRGGKLSVRKCAMIAQLTKRPFKKNNSEKRSEGPRGRPRLERQSVFTAQSLYVDTRRRGQRKGWRMRHFHTPNAVKKQAPSVLRSFESTLPAYSLNNLGHLILIWIKFKSRAQSTQTTCQKKPPLCIPAHTCGRMGWWGLQSVVHLPEQTAASRCRFDSSLIQLSSIFMHSHRSQRHTATQTWLSLLRTCCEKWVLPSVE